MTLATIIGFAAILSFLSLKNTFFGLKLMAGMSWFVLFIYLKDNVPDSITEGSGVHTALLVVIVGFGIMIVLSGLGRGISRSRKWQTGEETMGGDFQWKLPNWMKFSEDNPENRTKNTDDALRDYRETLRRAYKSGEFRKGGRR